LEKISSNELRVIITFSGHSRRFKQAGYVLPKFLIKLDDEPIIKHVINMFANEDFFDLIFNKDQIIQFPQIRKILEETLPKNNYRIIEIEPHEMGPAFSVNQLEDIDENEKVLISYCDFLVDWDYKQFCNSLEDCDGAIPAFQGFQPASFGSTLYAYMRVNKDDHLLELREKKNFTDTRHQEPASVGLYYFKKWSYFKHSYNKSVNEKIFEGYKEHYVSLIYNELVKEGFIIKVPLVKKFICLGTPEDLDQYLNWYQYFKKKNGNSLELKNLINLIPMAGVGKRFKDHGYKISKPLILIDSTPMVIKSCNSFPIPENWIFILKKEDNIKFKIKEKINNNFKNAQIIPIENATTGQAATCLYAKDLIKDDKSIYVASADYELFFNQKKFLDEIMKNIKIDAVVFTKKLKGNLIKNPKAFGYCQIDDENRITKITEKQTISTNPGYDPLVVGSFWFRSSKLFFSLLDQIIKKDIKINGEHYIANGMNLLIKKNYNVVSFDVDEWISFGDPFELELYYFWSEYFNERK